MIINLDDVFFFTLGDRDFYEPGDRRRVSAADFIEPISRRLPEEWTHVRNGFWVHCRTSGAPIPKQGWKIHLSATPENALPILTIAARVLTRRGVQFKFAADRVFLRWSNGKRWPRGGSGKFVTAYPRSVNECGEVLEELRSALVGYAGPYILSDRRYRDSGVVFYRYGGFANIERATVDGRMTKLIQLQDRTSVEDQRGPTFQLPPGVTDPFEHLAPAESDAGEPGTLNGGRYQIVRALTYTNVGGVFEAIDRTTGARVVIKEARPHTGASEDGRDALCNLRKEYRLLSLLRESHVAPAPLELFRDWEHYYLVEEFVEGESLRQYMATRTIVLRNSATSDDVRDFFATFCRVYSRVADALAVLHERHILFGDISHHNVIVLPDGESVRLIDFEGAFEKEVDPFPQLATQGFSSPQVRGGQVANLEDELYGFGGLLFAGIFPILDFTVLDARAHERFLPMWSRDFGLPEGLCRLIRRLLHPERQFRPSLTDAKRVLATVRVTRTPAIGASETDGVDLVDLCSRTAEFITSTMTPERTDRLFPGSPEVFAGHPASFAFGAAGVAYALKRMSGEVDERILDWICAQPSAADRCAPGLYVGASGIAWTLLELGRLEDAARFLAAADSHPLLGTDPDLFVGAAGVGLAHLKFFIESGDEAHLAAASALADQLTAMRVPAEGGCYWSKAGQEHSGLGHGGAGVALFLLYLALASGDQHYLEVGCEALGRVIHNGVPTPDGGLAWRITEGRSTVMPSWRWGTAGVGMTLLRYRAALGDARFDSTLQAVNIDTDRKYSIFPSRQLGLSGWGEYHLDCLAFGFDREYARQRATRVLAGILPFGVERGDGVAFPGETRTKLSCDFATGGAGIGDFIRRFLHGGAPTLMIDELLDPAATNARGHRSVLASGTVQPKAMATMNAGV